MLKLSDLGSWEGQVGRGPYLLWGAILMAVKYNLDRLVAGLFFDRLWSPLSYLEPAIDRPASASTVLGIPAGDLAFYATLVLMALPFIWAGVVLTIKRLRDVNLPPWLVAGFFLPFVNFLFFLMLAMLPSRSREVEALAQGRKPWQARLDALVPASTWGAACLALFLTLVLGSVLTVFGIAVLGQYGWGIFVGLPFLLGMNAALVLGYHRPRSYLACVGVAAGSIAVLGAGLLAVAIEGVLCIAMASPLGLILATLGATVGYFLQRRPDGPTPLPQGLAMLMLAQPLMMGFEAHEGQKSPLIPVRTAVEVAAPPEVVWRHVVTFTELPPPDDFLFRAGVAYPMRARIIGQGVGAVRHCEFSTGPFVEPITVWNEPNLLKFDVTSQPPSMRELSPYPNLQAPHLDHYLRSRGGQFLLTRLPGGRTRLEGTTWYTHDLWPQRYWQVWTDGILHAIHWRVLSHVKRLAEADRAGA